MIRAAAYPCTPISDSADPSRRRRDRTEFAEKSPLGGGN
jgi:hypothetical protein